MPFLATSSPEANGDQNPSVTERTLALPTWLRIFAPVLLVVALAAHAVTVVVWPGHQIMIDVLVYSAGGDVVLQGRPLYAGPVLNALEFTYTPFAALIFTPLALFDPDTLKILSTVANLALLVAAIWLSLRRLGYRANRDLVLLTVLLTGPLFWLEAVRTTFWLGQINLLLLVIVLWDLTSRAGNRWKGVGVGIAAGIKLTPAIFIVYLLVTRRFRAAGVATASFLGTIGLGFLVIPADAVQYWTGTFFTSGRVGPTIWPSNQSVRGMLARFFGTNEPPTILWLVVAGALGLAGLAVAAWAANRGNELLGVTMCGLTATMVSPFSWCHHWVWFVPLLVFGVHAALTHRAKGASALIAAVYLLGFAWLVKVHQLTPPHTPPPDSGLFLWDAPAWLEPVSRNVYLLAFVLALGYVAQYLRHTSPSNL